MAELYRFKEEDAFRFADTVMNRAKEIHRDGDELHFKYCPICLGGDHKDMNTFSINLKTGTWNCKRGSCGRKGNMITLAQEFADFSLGNDGVDDYYLKRERFRKFVRRPVESTDEAVQYLKKRGIPEEITRKYEITMHKEKDGIMVFPFVDDKDDMWFVKYRNIKYEKGVSKGPKEWPEKDRKPILFGMNHCNFENRTLVMTEGQIDALSCAAAGIENAVSVPMGKNVFTWVPYCFNFMGRFEELIVFGDLEDGEITLLESMKTRFHGSIKHVRPEDYQGCKDANEILQKYGEDAVRKCVSNAVAIPVPYLKRGKDIQKMSLDDREYMLTGITELDKKCRFYFGELIILTGAAGEGKSTMASQWVSRAIDQGYNAMIYSGEMQDWMVKNWLDMQIAGKHNLTLNNDIELETYQKIINSEMYGRYYVYEAPDDGTQETLIETIKNSIQQYGTRFIVIDNLMTVLDCDDHMELNEAQTAYTRRLAKIAQDSDVIIILIVHPRKSSLQTFSNDDIAGSSNIVNRAHKTIRYSRPKKEFTDADGVKWTKDELYDCPIRELTVLKDRFTGRTISKGIPLYFEEATKRISENKQFGWTLSWEEDFKPADNLDEIPF